MVKNVLFVGLLMIGLSSFVAGCGCPACNAGNTCSVGPLALDATRQLAYEQNYGEGVVDSKAQRWTRINLARDIDDREFRDDLDYILMLERNSYLTEWHPGVKR